MLARTTRKRLVAAIAGLFFLLCQGLALAQACSLSATQSESQNQQPCHSAGEPQDSNTASGQGQCETTSPIASGFSFFGIDELLALTVRLPDSHLAAAPEPSSFESPLLRIEPPPLRIVHCCLRN